MQRLPLLTALLLSAALLISCARAPGGDEPSGDFQAAPDPVGAPVETYEELTAALGHRGSTVNTLESIEQPFFEPVGQGLEVDGHQIQVFEYASVEDALAAAQGISADGSSIGTTMVSWVETPHFFTSGTLIVLYVGDAQTVLETLQAIMGPQIAGR